MMSMLMKWKIRISSFEKELLSKKLLRQQQGSNTCGDDNNQATGVTNKTLQTDENPDDVRKTALKQNQWPINPSNSTHRFNHDEFSDDDEEDSSSSMDVIEAIENAVDDDSSGEEIVTKVINYMKLEDVRRPEKNLERLAIQDESEITQKDEAVLKPSAQSSKTPYNIFTTATTDTQSKAVTIDASDASEPKIPENRVVAANQISLLESTKNAIVHVIDQQLMKLQSQRSNNNQLISVNVNDAPGDFLGKLMRATEFKKQSLRKESIRKIREEVDIIEQLEDC